MLIDTSEVAARTLASFVGFYRTVELFRTTQRESRRADKDGEGVGERGLGPRAWSSCLPADSQKQKGAQGGPLSVRSVGPL